MIQTFIVVILAAVAIVRAVQVAPISPAMPLASAVKQFVIWARTVMK
jgi:hypothetical protein